MSEFSNALSVSASGLKAQSQRLRHVAENIANADTPGYRRKTVAFRPERGEEATGRVETGPVRLDLFGDVLDGARRFDPATQRTTEKLARVEFAPVSEVILDEAAITRFRQNYRIEFGAAGTDDPLYEAVSAGRKHAGIEHWLPFFHERLETVFDYLLGASVMLDDQLDPACRAGRGSPTSMTTAARRCAARTGPRAPTSPVRRDCCIWTMPDGRARWPGTGLCSSRHCRSRWGLGCWMPAGGSGGISRRSGSWKM